MSRNECGKMRDKENPYARWVCAVSSPYTWGSFELGDVYVSEIKENGDLGTE